MRGMALRSVDLFVGQEPDEEVFFEGWPGLVSGMRARPFLLRRDHVQRLQKASR
jgi:hypothetical protein